MMSKQDKFLKELQELCKKYDTYITSKDAYNIQVTTDNSETNYYKVISKVDKFK